jgi:nitrogenase iron protein NifH
LKKIAIYGKGGIGKSTTAANLSAALAEQGNRVMQIGCDPKADSTCLLMNGKSIPTILDTLRTKASSVVLEDMVYQGFDGVLCAECGGPTPGVGCAGRGIIASFEKLEALKAYETYRPDIILYDVLGDVVCGGFAMPLRKGYADEIYIVTSGEKMSLFAARNIAQAVAEFKGRGYAQLKGIILNARGIANESEIVRKAAAELETAVVAEIPRDPTIQACEERNKTVMQGAPDSSLADKYRMLASFIMS